MAIIVEVYSHLLPWVDSIPPQYRSWTYENRKWNNYWLLGSSSYCARWDYKELTGSDPNSSQSICIHLVFFYQTLPLFMDINASVLTVVDFVVPHNWITVGTNLYTRKCVSIDVVVFDETTPLPKNVYSALVSVVNLIPSNGWVWVGRDPHPGKVVGVNTILNKLTLSRFVHVYATRLPVMDFASHHCRISASWYKSKTVKLWVYQTTENSKKKKKKKSKKIIPFTSNPAIRLLWMLLLSK